MRSDISPAYILQIGMGFWASRTLLSAVELGLFTELAEGPKTGVQLEQALGLHPRATYDFLDALVSLGLLDREGDGPEGVYANTLATAAFLDRRSPEYIGGILEMAAGRLFRFWADLTTALKTGRPQNEIKLAGRSMFDTLYAEPARLEQFMDAMSGVSMANFETFAQKFDFSPYRTLVDIGGATAQLSCFVAGHQPHMRCASYDLPVVQPIAERRISEAGLGERVKAGSIDFFDDEFPNADIITKA